MCNLNEETRKQLWTKGFEKGWEEALAEGLDGPLANIFAEGFAKGYVEGYIEGYFKGYAIEIIANMNQKGFSLKQISDITNKSPDEVKAILESKG